MTAAAGITTSGQPPTAVVSIQPGMSVQPVVLVDQNGQYVTPGGSSTTAGSLATTTVPVNVAAATAPTSGQVLTATAGTAATWQTLPTGTTSTKGVLQLDGTASDIQPVGTAAAAGAVGKPSDAGHVHAGLALLATTGVTGYAKVNGTGNILTWTAPNDGAMHRVILLAVERVTSNETGGTIQVVSGFPDGTTATAKTLFTASQAAGYQYTTNTPCPTMFLLGPNTTFTVSQSLALSAGASTVWVELWGS